MSESVNHVPFLAVMRQSQKIKNKNPAGQLDWKSESEVWNAADPFWILLFDLFLARNIRISLDQSGSYEGREAVVTGRFYLWQKLDASPACKWRQPPDNLAQMLQCLRFLDEISFNEEQRALKVSYVVGGLVVFHVTDSRFIQSPSRLFWRAPHWSKCSLWRRNNIQPAVSVE